MIAAAVLFFMGQKKGYRIIKIYELDGRAVIDREKTGEMEAYENLTLLSNDFLRVHEESYVRLRMDEDKYMMVEPESELLIIATGTGENSKTDIQLRKGAVNVEIQNKLSDSSSYQITTPNAVMAIRGTVFRVEVSEDADGCPVTLVTLFEGKVAVQKKNEDGTLSAEQIVDSGKEVLIARENEEVVIQILDEIDYTKLPVEALKNLEGISIDGRILCWTTEEIQEMIYGKPKESDSDKKETKTDDEKQPPEDSRTEEKPFSPKTPQKEEKPPAQPPAAEPNPAAADTQKPETPPDAGNPQQPNIDNGGGTNPTKPEEPEKPTEKPTKSEEPEKPTEKPTKPEEPEKPTETDETEKPTEPEEPEKPTESTETENTETESTETENTETENTETENTETESTETEETETEEKEYTVTFVYNGTTFGTQTVKAGEKVQKPKLLPAENGSWDFDFTTPIEKDTVIQFQ